MGRRAPQGILSIAGTGELNNYAFYSNSTFDDLIEKGMSIIEDTSERNEMFRKAFEIILEEVPVLTIHNPKVVEACRANVKNFHPYAGGRVNLHRVDIE